MRTLHSLFLKPNRTFLFTKSYTKDSKPVIFISDYSQDERLLFCNLKNTKVERDEISRTIYSQEANILGHTANECASHRQLFWCYKTLGRVSKSNHSTEQQGEEQRS